MEPFFSSTLETVTVSWAVPLWLPSGMNCRLESSTCPSVQVPSSFRVRVQVVIPSIAVVCVPALRWPHAGTPAMVTVSRCSEPSVSVSTAPRFRATWLSSSPTAATGFSSGASATGVTVTVRWSRVVAELWPVSFSVVVTATAMWMSPEKFLGGVRASPSLSSAPVRCQELSSAW